MSRPCSSRFVLLVALGTVMCPVLAHADGYAVDPESQFWVSLGLGGGKAVSGSQAPSAEHSGFVLNIEGGYRFNSQWGLGLEFGALATSGGCDGLGCTPASPDFAPSFSHFFAVGEYRPASTGWRLRAGAGISSMCYSWYKSHANAVEKFFTVLLGNDDPTDYSISCRSLSAPGVSAAVGYQWSFPNSHTSLGLQLRGEAANFSASSRAGLPAFHHRAVMLQAVLSLN